MPLDTQSAFLLFAVSVAVILSLKVFVGWNFQQAYQMASILLLLFALYSVIASEVIPLLIGMILTTAGIMALVHPLVRKWVPFSLAWTHLSFGLLYIFLTLRAAGAA